MYCLDDGAALLEGPSSGNEHATAFLPHDSFEESPTRTIGVKDSIGGRVSGSTSPEVTPRQGRGKLWIFALLGAVILAVGGFAVYRTWKPAEPQRSGPLQIEKLTTNGQANSAAISPDGKYVIYSVDEGGKDSLWLRQVATSSNVQIFQPEEDVYYWGLTFSPDSEYINFVRAEFEKNIGWGLKQMSVLGGPQKTLVDAEGGISYSPDGTQFAFLRDEFPTPEQSSLMVANADGTGERVVASRKKPEVFRARRVAPAWSPDGSSIAAIVSDESALVHKMQVAEFDVSGGQERPIATQEWKQITAIAWTGNKRGILVLGADKASSGFANQIWHFSYPDGPARRITTDLNHYLSLSLSADSQKLVTVQANEISNIWSGSGADLNRAVQVRSGGTNQEGIDGLAVAADGRIVFHSRASGAEDLWIMNPDGSSPKQLTSQSGANFGPSVSSDGKYVIYTSERDGNVNIWRMGLDGSGAIQLTRSNNAYEPSVSADSRWVVYTSETAGNSHLWKVSIDGGEPARVTQAFAQVPEVSPDGKLIVCSYRNDENSTWRYAVIPFDGGEPIKVFDLIGKKGYFRWSPDSRSLYYLRDTKGGVTNLWSFTIDSGETKQITDFKTDAIFDFARSGDHFVYSRGTPTSDVVIIRNF